jgi:antitoxin component YwqK of YwqJK toxin-antitoxin module
MIIFLLLLSLLMSSCNKPDKGYWEDGTLKFVLHKKGGHYNGLSTWYYSHGVKQHECYYVNDTLQGASTRWYDNGKIHSVEFYKNNLLHGQVLGYDYDGNLISEANYSEGILDGSFKEYYPSGKPKIEGTYNKGLFNGRWMYFDPDGNLTGIGEFKDGKGRQRAWYGNGNLKRVVPYNDNLKHGTEIWYLEDGKIEKTLVYEMGQLVSEGNQSQ